MGRSLAVWNWRTSLCPVGFPDMNFDDLLIHGSPYYQGHQHVDRTTDSRQPLGLSEETMRKASANTRRTDRGATHSRSDGLWYQSCRRVPITEVWTSQGGREESQCCQAVRKAHEGGRPGGSFEEEQVSRHASCANGICANVDTGLTLEWGRQNGCPPCSSKTPCRQPT
jgi:hypothetical protein